MLRQRKDSCPQIAGLGNVPGLAESAWGPDGRVFGVVEGGPAGWVER